MLSKNFHILFRLLTLKENSPQLFLDTYFTVTYFFLMNWISRSLSICKFFCSSSQMFGHIGVLKNYAKFTRKYQCWSRFLIKLQFSYFQPSTFIKKETPAQVLSYESCENFKNTFFIEQPRVIASVTATLLKYFF